MQGLITRAARNVKMRTYLDRRRLEEGFLFLALLDVVNKYKLPIDDIPFDKNKLVEMVTKEYQEQFGEKWTGTVQLNYPG